MGGDHEVAEFSMDMYSEVPARLHSGVFLSLGTPRSLPVSFSPNMMSDWVNISSYLHIT